MIAHTLFCVPYRIRVDEIGQMCRLQSFALKKLVLSFRDVRLQSFALKKLAPRASRNRRCACRDSEPEHMTNAASPTSPSGLFNRFNYGWQLQFITSRKAGQAANCLGHFGLTPFRIT